MVSFVWILQYLCYVKSNGPWVILIPFEMFTHHGEIKVQRFYVVTDITSMVYFSAFGFNVLLKGCLFIC